MHRAQGIQRGLVLTSWGEIDFRYDGSGVLENTLPRLDGNPEVPFAVERAGRDPYATYIRDLLEGRKAALPSVGPLEGTPFQRKVWQGLLTIPRGETRSYGELAKQLGCPRAYRAVANACGRNPIPLFIPCHRVVGAHGALGGFSSGLAWKRLLLECERKYRF